MQIDRDAPLRFLKAAFEPDDWIAVLLKRHDTGEAIQRVGPLDMMLAPRFQSWLRFKNAHGFSVFVSVNALTPGRRSRTRESVSAVRHVFLDADRDCERVLATIERRPDLPPASFVIRTSPGRAHVLWRVAGISVGCAETLQKHLARRLGTDMAATAATQMTRLPGFANHKHALPNAVTQSCTNPGRKFRAISFPAVVQPELFELALGSKPKAGEPKIRSARAYIAATPPAVAGHHGDARTFGLCCQLFRWFELTDEQVATMLSAWNTKCVPPWTEQELERKVKRARKATVLGRQCVSIASVSSD